MRQSILPSFLTFPKEGAIIGRLLVSYAEIEIALLHCLSKVHDLDTPLKKMFGRRGESRRLDEAEKYGKQHFNGLSLGTEFKAAVDAARYCLRIRNQFAHSSLYDDYSGKLAFVNIEELAQQSVVVTDLHSLTIHHVDETLLQEMESYFVHTDTLLLWLNHEALCRSGKQRQNPFPNPPQVSKPPLHLP